MKQTWSREGTAWRREGILQDQSLGASACVPNATPAATTLPMNQEALKIEVRTGRSLG